jgi:hypothetical protein
VETSVGPIPLIQMFLHLFKLPPICKLQNPTSYAPKFTKLCKAIESIIRNGLPSGKEFKFPTEFELKNLGSKLILNMG